MSKRKITTGEMVARTKNKALSCSTPERYSTDSPTRDSDSIYDSDTASPVPFLCTQDGAEGETDVVWNFYTPKSEIGTSRCKNKTPLSRKAKKTKQKLIDKPLAKRKPIRQTQKSNELFQELFELKKNVQEYITKKPLRDCEKPHSEDDIFSDNSDSSPKSISKSSSHCLRKNVLSSKFSKPETENGLESDDSMNEYLLKASQAVEQNIIYDGPTKSKRTCREVPKVNNNKSIKVTIGNDSMDALLSNIKLDSPNVSKLKFDSPKINNDSFDNLLENLNDSALEKLSQMPLNHESKNTPLNTSKESSWKLKEVVNCDNSPSSTSMFGRHNSMPESPSTDINKSSMSGMGFGRYNSMPFNKSINKEDSPIKCTPDEIEKKRKQAREKLLAKRLLPFTQQPNKKHERTKLKPILETYDPASKTKKTSDRSDASENLKSVIEKKRLEALMRLRKRHHT